LVPENTAVPLPAFTRPPDPLIDPAKVTVAVELPNVNVLDPNKTLLHIAPLQATPLKSFIVIAPLAWLISKTDEDEFTDTPLEEERVPAPDNCNVPLLMVVAPV